MVKLSMNITYLAYLVSWVLLITRVWAWVALASWSTSLVFLEPTNRVWEQYAGPPIGPISSIRSSTGFLRHYNVQCVLKIWMVKLSMNITYLAYLVSWVLLITRVWAWVALASWSTSLVFLEPTNRVWEQYAGPPIGPISSIRSSTGFLRHYL